MPPRSGRFVIPNAAERQFFYGVNFEFSYAMPQFSETRWNMEIRPIVGWRKGNYEFIINPIVDLGFGQNGGAEFVPAAPTGNCGGHPRCGGHSQQGSVMFCSWGPNRRLEGF